MLSIIIEDFQGALGAQRKSKFSLGRVWSGEASWNIHELSLRDGQAPPNRRRKERKFKEEDPVCVKS